MRETSGRWFPETVCPHLKIGEYYHNVFRLICIGITDQIRTKRRGEQEGERRARYERGLKARPIFPRENKRMVNQLSERTRLRAYVARLVSRSKFSVLHIVNLPRSRLLQLIYNGIIRTRSNIDAAKNWRCRIFLQARCNETERGRIGVVRACVGTGETSYYFNNCMATTTTDKMNYAWFVPLGNLYLAVS